MQNTRLQHLIAVFQALLVTFLWSTSWVLIKIGLEDIPALTFAGLRYTLAFLFLLPVVSRRGNKQIIKNLNKRQWIGLLVLGVLFYSVTQGAQFLSLFYLPAITGSLLLSLTPVIVALLGIFFLKEHLLIRQWMGVGLYLMGLLIFFAPNLIPEKAIAIGMFIALIGVAANALSSILGRHINKNYGLKPSIVTLVSMGTGAFILLAIGVVTQGLPHLTWKSWLIILWLAGINSAFAFTLWNHTLRTLMAVESSIINNTMLFQIAILAWIFLGEDLTSAKLLGMILAAIGTFIIQWRNSRN